MVLCSTHGLNPAMSFSTTGRMSHLYIPSDGQAQAYQMRQNELDAKHDRDRSVHFKSLG